jgi:hypothetical protein
MTDTQRLDALERLLWQDKPLTVGLVLMPFSLTKNNERRIECCDLVDESVGLGASAKSALTLREAIDNLINNGLTENVYP